MTHARIRQLAVATLAALTIGCSSLPPAQPAKDLTAIAGQWRGTMLGGNGARMGVTMTITADGRYQTVLDQPKGSMGTTFPGTVAVEGSKFRFRSERTGNTGTLTLHEGDGKRVLTVRADNNRSEGELTPAPPQGTAADLAPADGTRDGGRR